MEEADKGGNQIQAKNIPLGDVTLRVFGSSDYNYANQYHLIKILKQQRNEKEY
jgi:hypothetical protein